ncbi:MAG: sulfatase family protein, partial [Verrucomicrobiales bacterium]
CSPSRASFLTGLYPHLNGQIGLATHKFAMYQDWPNLFTVLKSGGYRTGLIGKLHVNPESAFPVDFRAIRGANFGERDMREYAAQAAKFFTADRDRPFFLSINYPDAHFPLHRQQFGLPENPLGAGDVKPLPWVGADSPRLRGVTADYYNCMRRLDDGVALLLEELKKSGAADNTLIIYIGDHGAQFSRGKCTVYEAGLRVPFIVSWPGRAQPGQVRRELVSTLDIMPLACAVADIPPPENLSGLNLMPLLEGKPAENWREFIYGFTTGAAPAIFCLQHSVRDSRWKLISNPLPSRTNGSAKAYRDSLNAHFVGGTRPGEIAAASEVVRAAYRRFLTPPRYELYDLDSDPYELDNLAENPAYAAQKLRLIRALETWQERHRDPFGEQALMRGFAERQSENLDLKYRKNKTFRWPYLDQFPSFIRND